MSKVRTRKFSNTRFIAPKYSAEHFVPVREAILDIKSRTHLFVGLFVQTKQTKQKLQTIINQISPFYGKDTEEYVWAQFHKEFNEARCAFVDCVHAKGSVQTHWFNFKDRNKLKWKFVFDTEDGPSTYAWMDFPKTMKGYYL